MDSKYHIHESMHELHRVQVNNPAFPRRLNRPRAPPILFAGIIVTPEQAHVLVVVQNISAGLHAPHPERLAEGRHRLQLFQCAANQLQDALLVAVHDAAVVNLQRAPVVVRLDGAGAERRRGRGDDSVCRGFS
jgi:hypothetical protein